MKIKLKFSFVVIWSLVALATKTSLAKEKVLVLSSQKQDISFLEAGFSGKYEISRVVDVSSIRTNEARLLMISGEKNLPPEFRLPIHHFIRSGGNVILIGKTPLNYSPQPAMPVSLVSFNKDFNIVYPKRKVVSGSLDKPTISKIDAGNKKNGIQFLTKNRGMTDVMFGIALKHKRSEKKNVISFKAKGSHFMDLLALEIKDISGNKWYSFMPVSRQWEDYSVSFADFIPEGWQDASNPYPLLNPQHADSLYIGINTMTVWKEKAMDFSLADMTLAENTGSYTPSSILTTLRLPFKEIGIASPEWIIDPFLRAIERKNVLAANAGTYFYEKKYDKKLAVAWNVPAQFYEHPGTAMGTDTDKKYDNKLNRLHRREKILIDPSTGETIAEFVQYAGGKYKNASMSLFGCNSGEVINDKQFLEKLSLVIDKIISSPKILNVSVNTTQKLDNSSISPVIKVDVFNPGRKAIKGKISINIDDKLKNEIPVTIGGNKSEQYPVTLPEVPVDFSLPNFRWEVRFAGPDSEDAIRDTVNVERSMLTAFKYLVKAQKFYPDGRYSNHYFGDAYGVRAMFAYLDYLDKKTVKHNTDKGGGGTIGKDDIKNSAEWFYDMLAKRQLVNGAYPMGYSEHTRGYNVADGGQIGLSIGQSLQYIKDPLKKQLYLNSVTKFGNWAESYYIDSALSLSLKTSHPKDYQKGQAYGGLYGLGPSGDKHRRTGPSWVLSDIIAAQITLSHLAADSVRLKFEDIAQRNSVFYANKRYNAMGYYQAEALFWIYLNTKDEGLKKIVLNNLEETFLKPLYKGKENDMYDLGSRATLKALSLLYYRSFIQDNADIRAVLLKYIWSFGSETSTNSIKYLAETFPKAIHGESLTVAKYAALSSLWAIELLYPKSTLIEFK